MRMQREYEQKRSTTGFRVSGLGFGVWGLGFGVWCLGFGVYLCPNAEHFLVGDQRHLGEGGEGGVTLRRVGEGREEACFGCCDLAGKFDVGCNGDGPGLGVGGGREEGGTRWGLKVVEAYVTRHTEQRHTSHVTRHTSHFTRHTSHVTLHTSHVTRHTSPGSR
jgi:hypothetical protein